MVQLRPRSAGMPAEDRLEEPPPLLSNAKSTGGASSKEENIDGLKMKVLQQFTLSLNAGHLEQAVANALGTSNSSKAPGSPKPTAQESPQEVCSQSSPSSASSLVPRPPAGPRPRPAAERQALQGRVLDLEKQLEEALHKLALVPQIEEQVEMLRQENEDLRRDNFLLRSAARHPPTPRTCSEEVSVSGMLSSLAGSRPIMTSPGHTAGSGLRAVRAAHNDE